VSFLVLFLSEVMGEREEEDDDDEDRDTPSGRQSCGMVNWFTTSI